MEAHVARLHATVATIAHQERREHLDRLEVLRRHTFGLDHLFMSLFSTLGWMLRLGIVVALLATRVDPVLVLLLVFALPTVVTATWRPGVERADRRTAPARDARLARHLFVLGTTAAPGQGGAGHRQRRRPGTRAARGVAALATRRWPGPAG